MSKRIQVGSKKVDYTEFKRLLREIKKCKELVPRICKYRIRDGHQFMCEYEGSEAVTCNKIGRENCPIYRLLEDLS